MNCNDWSKGYNRQSHANYTTTELIREKIKAQQALIIDTILDYYSSFFKSIVKDENRDIYLEFPDQAMKDLGLKLAMIQKLEDNPPKGLEEYPVYRLEQLIILSSFDMRTFEGDLSTTVDEKSALQIVRNHIRNILLEKNGQESDRQEILEGGVSLAIIYGYLLQVKRFRQEVIALLWHIDFLANKFFFAFGTLMDAEDEITSIVDQIQHENLIKNSVTKRGDLTQEKHHKLVSIVDKAFKAGKFTTPAGSPVGDLILEISLYLKEVNKEREKEIKPYSTKHLKPLIVKYFDIEKNGKIRNPKKIKKKS